MMSQEVPPTRVGGKYHFWDFHFCFNMWPMSPPLAPDCVKLHTWHNLFKYIWRLCFWLLSYSVTLCFLLHKTGVTLQYFRHLCGKKNVAFWVISLRIFSSGVYHDSKVNNTWTTYRTFACHSSRCIPFPFTCFRMSLS